MSAMNKTKSLILFLLLGLVIFPGCRNRHYKVNLSSVESGISILRLEKELFSIEPHLVAMKIPELTDRYEGPMQLLSLAINTGYVHDSSFTSLMTLFCTDRINNEVYRRVEEKYAELGSAEEDLDQAFRHYRYYFPAKKVPYLFTCTTGFNASILTISGDTLLGISLDRYLGRDCEYYPRLGIYGYLSARMNDYNIVPDVMYALAATEWNYEELGYSPVNVFSRMIHEGKVKYFQKCMLPAVNDTVIFGFTEAQLKFCRNNEAQMWQYLAENELLFSTDQFTIKKLTDEAPFTSYFTNESPGRAALWIGFRIVESFMMKNSSISLETLMKNTDYQGILTGARYMPQ
jgi:hypothetical protein